VERAFGREIAQQAKIVEWQEQNYYDDPCRARDHFGCVHWTDDDIVSRFQTMNIPVTPELLKKAKNNIGPIDDAMTEVGWEVIEYAIHESLEENTE
jgi:hypothetical protein